MSVPLTSAHLGRGPEAKAILNRVEVSHLDLQPQFLFKMVLAVVGHVLGATQCVPQRKLLYCSGKMYFNFKGKRELLWKQLIICRAAGGCVKPAQSPSLEDT